MDTLICTYGNGVAIGHFSVNETYVPDNRGRITTVNGSDTDCLSLWTVFINNIYLVADDPASELLVSFETN